MGVGVTLHANSCRRSPFACPAHRSRALTRPPEAYGTFQMIMKTVDQVGHDGHDRRRMKCERLRELNLSHIPSQGRGSAEAPPRSAKSTCSVPHRMKDDPVAEAIGGLEGVKTWVPIYNSNGESI